MRRNSVKTLRDKKGISYSAAPEAKPMARHTGIQKLSNGRFRARYFRGYDAKSGRRVYPAKTFDTERQAREWRAGEVASKGSNIVEGRGVLLSAYLDHWLSTKVNVRKNTQRSYKNLIEMYIKPGLGHIKLVRLTPTEIESWQADLLKRISATTVSNARVILHGALKSAQRKNLIKSNPVANTDSPGRAKPGLHPLTIEEALCLLAHCEQSRSGLAFELMLTCGLRPEEAMGLRWQDLELLPGVRGVLRVSQVVVDLRSAGWVWEEPKTKNSERVLKFSAELASKLLEHRRSVLERKLQAGQHWQDHNLVFPDPIGAPIKYSTLARRFTKMVEAAGLPSKVTLYTLRHFFVTSSLVAGVDARTVSREAGHSKVSFTLDRYGHVLDEMHDTAATKREELLRNRSRK